MEASSDVLANRLEALATVSDVSVSRRANGLGYDWVVTFVGELGDVPVLEISTSAITGPGADAEVAVVQTGVLPRDYAVVQQEAVGSTSAYTVQLAGLRAGRAYGVRVAAKNALNGFGPSTFTHPRFELPRTAPGAPRVSALHVLSDTSLKLSWQYP